MARRYSIQKRDTLRAIAERFYGDAALFSKLARYNGILDPGRIAVGQFIEIPSRRELEGAVSEPSIPVGGLVPPVGLDGILEAFGNIYEFIRDDGGIDPRWEIEHLSRAPLAFSVPLAWDRSRSVRRMQCHARLVDVFSEVFHSIGREGLKDKISTFGGCYNFRSKRTSGKLSTHCWGIAVDLNPETNPQGTPGNMDAGIVKIFRDFGFKWGGDWSGRSKDPMHFQFCTGY